MRVGIGLGSNLGDRQANLRRARCYLRALPCVASLRASGPLFATSPVGCGDSAGEFLNTVVEVKLPNDADLHRLLVALRGIETALGRPTWHPKNASRSIDLDILYAGETLLETPLLTVPHPRLHQRRFVLAPLAAICPDLVLPGQQQSVAELLAALDDDASVHLVSATW